MANNQSHLEFGEELICLHHVHDVMVDMGKIHILCLESDNLRQLYDCRVRILLFYMFMLDKVHIALLLTKLLLNLQVLFFTSLGSLCPPLCYFTLCEQS